MKKILAIGGVPGTGKTTLMREFMAQFDDWERVKPQPLVDCEYSKEGNIYVIGKYDEGEVFAGTDKLSMATQPNALTFVQETDANIIFEGDRLFNGSFLRSLVQHATSVPHVDLKIILLTASQSVLQKRYGERGSDQSEQFLRSRMTKYDNLLMSFDLMDLIEETRNEILEDQTVVLKEMQNFFGFSNSFA